MGVLDELGYTVEPANLAQRATQTVTGTRAGAWISQRTLYPLDKALFRASGGRLTVPGLMAGLPVIMLTTTGAKSGQPRTMPLVGTPFGDDLAIIGSNYGQQRTPGWVYNLGAIHRRPCRIATVRSTWWRADSTRPPQIECSRRRLRPTPATASTAGVPTTE